MEFSLFYLGLNLAAGAVIGFTTGLCGAGAGVLVMPCLIHLLGVPALPAVGTGLVFGAITRIAAAVEHLRLGTVRERSAFYFLLGSIPPVVLASLVLNCLPARINLAALNDFLQHLIGAMILLVAILLMIEGYLFAPSRGAGSRQYYRPQPHYPLRLKIGAILFGILTGLVIGTTSIGGGVIIIPILLIFFRLHPADTVGTSIVISVVLAFFGSFAYIGSGNVAWQPALLLSLTALPGAMLGSRLAGRMNERMLRIIIILLVMAAAASLL